MSDKQYVYRCEYLNVNGKDIDKVIKILVDKRQEIYSKENVKPDSVTIEVGYEGTSLELTYFQLENE